MHGGKNPGPRNAKGRERCSLARWKRGFSTNTAVAERRRMRAALTAECGKLMKALPARPAA
jgi:hypothetical protein